MMTIILILILLLFSVLLIWKGSDWITDSVIPVANVFGTGYIAITTLLVSFLISVPELFTAIHSYFLGHYNIGIGVIIGSVMINIGLTVGLSAMIRPLYIEKGVIIRDGIFLIIIASIVLLLGTDLEYTRNEGIILLLLFVPYSLNVWLSEKTRTKKSQKIKVSNIKKSLDLFGNISFFSFKPSFFTFMSGAAILTLGSYLFSFSLVRISSILPIPEIMIGIIIGGIGTGMPNIAAAIQGTIKGYKDAAISETLGSNIFTLLITLGALIVLNPFKITAKIFYFDFTWMIIIHLLMISFIFKGYRYKEHSLTRYEGFFLIIFYLAILIVNYFL